MPQTDNGMFMLEFFSLYPLFNVHLRITFHIYLYAVTCRDDGVFISNKKKRKLSNEASIA